MEPESVPMRTNRIRQAGHCPRRESYCLVQWRVEMHPVKLKPSYGNPPWLVTDLFVKVLSVGLVIAIIGLVLAYKLTGPISQIDGIGTAIVTPIAAYLIHLWLAPDRAE